MLCIRTFRKAAHNSDYLVAGINIQVHQHQAEEGMGVIAHQSDLMKL